MKPDEAAEMMEPDGTGSRFKQRCAITIAALAMLLAITGLGGQNATKEALNANIQASNLFAFFQAKSQRQTSFALAADTFEQAVVNDLGLLDDVRAQLHAKVAKYKATIA